MQRRHSRKSGRKTRSGPRATEPGRKRDFAKAVLERPLELEELPDLYDQTRVVLLPVDPYLIHVYWEIAGSDAKQARLRAGASGPEYQATLRFHDITDTLTDHRSEFDVDIQLGPGNWYVRLWSPEKRYFADLGLRAEDGSFIPIARSNIIHTPRAHPSTNVDQGYLPIPVVPPRPPEVARTSPTASRQAADQQDFPRRELPKTDLSRGGAQVTNPETTRTVQPVDMAEKVRRKLADLYSRSRPPLRREAHLPTSPSADFSDLTEMNERSFAPGITSGGI